MSVSFGWYMQQRRWKCIVISFLLESHMYTVEQLLGYMNVFSSPLSFLSLLLAKIYRCHFILFLSNLILILFIAICFVFCFLSFLVFSFNYIPHYFILFNFYFKFDPLFFFLQFVLFSFSNWILFSILSHNIWFQIIFISNLVLILFIVISFVFYPFVIAFFFNFTPQYFINLEFYSVIF